MASSRDPKHQNRNFSDAKRHSRGAIALKLFARSLISCWAETAAPERRQLKRTLGRIALTVIDIGAIIGGEYPHSLEPQRRVNTEVPSMALLPCHRGESLRVHRSYGREITKRTCLLDCAWTPAISTRSCRLTSKALD